jgi:hypothetical protein
MGRTIFLTFTALAAALILVLLADGYRIAPGTVGALWLYTWGLYVDRQNTNGEGK